MDDPSPPQPLPNSSENDDSELSPDPTLWEQVQVQWHQDDLREAQHHDEHERFFWQLANTYAFSRSDLGVLATACAKWHASEAAALRTRVRNFRARQDGGVEANGYARVSLWDSSP